MATAVAARVVLDEVTLANAVATLVALDADLARVVDLYGPPPLWVREPGFPTLLYIILEQQVSLASARALYQRVLETVKPLTPGRFLKLSEMRLRELGFSRQKSLVHATAGGKAAEAPAGVAQVARTRRPSRARATDRIKGHWRVDGGHLSDERAAASGHLAGRRFGAGDCGARSKEIAHTSIAGKAGEALTTLATVARGGSAHFLACVFEQARSEGRGYQLVTATCEDSLLRQPGRLCLAKSTE